MNLISPFAKMIHFSYWKPLFTSMMPKFDLNIQEHTSIAPLPNLNDDHILQLNRNARMPKLANHGARPCSSVMRRLKKKGNYQKWKEKTIVDADEQNPRHGNKWQDEEDELNAQNTGEKKPEAGQ